MFVTLVSIPFVYLKYVANSLIEKKDKIVIFSLRASLRGVGGEELLEVTWIGGPGQPSCPGLFCFPSSNYARDFLVLFSQ